jgi:hypothetical protein
MATCGRAGVGTPSLRACYATPGLPDLLEANRLEGTIVFGLDRASLV